MYVYIEYAVIDNLVINYILIKTATKLCQVKTRFLLLFLATLLGTAIGVVIPLFNLNDWFIFIIKLLLGLLITFIGGSYITIKKYLLTYFVFLTLTFLSGGFIIALFNFAGVDYISLFSSNYDSLLPVGITVLFVYVISRISFMLVKKLISKRDISPFLRSCILVIDKNRISVKGFIDSGNSLYDKKSGLPVIVCSNLLFSKLQKLNLKSSVSSIEFITVSGTSTMNLYVVDKLMIYNGACVNIFNNVLLGVSQNGFYNDNYELLLHPSLLG